MVLEKTAGPEQLQTSKLDSTSVATHELLKNTVQKNSRYQVIQECLLVLESRVSKKYLQYIRAQKIMIQFSIHHNNQSNGPASMIYFIHASAID